MRQLPKLLAASAANDAAGAEGLEIPQAEPFSDYYAYQPSMILVQSDWVIPKEHRRGTLVIGTATTGEQLPETLPRGAVLEIHSETGSVICKADASWRLAFPGKVFEGKWARVNEPIQKANEGEFLNSLLALHPQIADAKPNHVKDGWLRIWAVLFPEEVAHREIGEGWVFACAVDKNRPQISRVPPHHLPKGQSHQHKQRRR